jgi:Nod factor-specific ABC transporter NodJ protein
MRKDSVNRSNSSSNLSGSNRANSSNRLNSSSGSNHLSGLRGSNGLSGLSCFFEWYPVFLREMLMFRRKLMKLGYLFSAMVVPIIYLVTFGLGLGRNVQIQGSDYLTYLLPGLVAMSSMNNSYTWVASALNLNRLYFKTFQVFVQAPIRPSSIMIGEVLAGMVKGLFASALILIVGFIVSRDLSITPLFVVTLLLNCFLFACLGVIVGMITKSHEDTSTYNNFFILPMAFFSGTFFPVDRMPELLKYLVYMLPLTHTNIVIRQTIPDAAGLLSLGVLAAYALAFFIAGSRLISNYSE